MTSVGQAVRLQGRGHFGWVRIRDHGLQFVIQAAIVEREALVLP